MAYLDQLLHAGNINNVRVLFECVLGAWMPSEYVCISV
jgi:hypothetical protein